MLNGEDELETLNGIDPPTNSCQHAAQSCLLKIKKCHSVGGKQNYVRLKEEWMQIL